MGGIKKFQKSVIAAMSPALVALATGDNEDSKALREAIKNHLFDLPGPKYANLPLTGPSAYVKELFRGFSEISRSLETLEGIQFLVGRFPFRSKRISAERYLQFHFEAYLAEVYVLKVRLDRYLKLLRRQHRGDARLAEICVHADALSQLVQASLKPILGIRHAHTHEERFKDEGISRLGTIALLMTGDDHKFATLMRNFYRIEHSKEKKRWKQIITRNNREIRRLLNAFLDDLHPLLFDEKTGHIRLPQKLAS